MTTETADDVLSDFLFARPSLLEGIARNVDLAGALSGYNVSKTGEEADARALYEDWKAVGHDMKVGLAQAIAESEADTDE